MKEVIIFGRVHKYTFDFEIENDIQVMKQLLEEIKKPQVLSYCGMDTINIYIKEDTNCICSDCIKWIYDQNKEKLKEESIRECLLKCAVEDELWAKNRNEDLTGVYYRKIIFLPEIQDMVCAKINEYVHLLDVLYSENVSESQKRKAERENQKCKWMLTNTFTQILPVGGENGRDGYIDAEYTSQAGEKVRMVSRDVFDVGQYSYPKRLERSDDALNQDTWTEAEKHLALWLANCGVFHGVRM